MFSFLKKHTHSRSLVCPTCSREHNEFSISFKHPSIQMDSPDDDITLDDDFCASKNSKDFFIRVILEIPIIGHHEPFLWGVWVSQSEENYKYYLDHFNEDLKGRHTFGWFSNTLPGYENTWSLQTQACFSGLKTRPKIELGECDHQLYKDFKNGITLQRAEELMKIFK